MKILLVSQYFPPEVNAPANRVSNLAGEWTRAGHDVTVLTGFPNHPLGVKRPQDRGVLTHRETVDGARVIRCYLWATPNKGTLKRMLSYATFMVSASFFGVFLCPKPDIVVATSPQLLCAAAGYALSVRFRAPFVFEVRDLWPESILAVDAMRENGIVRALKRLAAFLYQRARLIVTVGSGYKRKIVELYPVAPEKIAVVENGVDPEQFQPLPRDPAFAEEAGWKGKKVLLYAGTHGMAHGLSAALEAAALVRDRDDLLFAFVGEGAQKEALQTQARSLNLKNVRFYPQQTRDKLRLFYANCDLGLVHLRATPLFQEVLPSKIFEYLAMQRPVLIGVGGDAKKLVEDAGGGVYFEPENAAALARAFADAIGQPERLQVMGLSGRAYVTEHFNRAALARRYLGLLEGTLKGEGQ